MSASPAILDIKQYNIEVKPLTMIQLAFVSAYIANGGNGTQAAKEAGYKCRSQAAFATQATKKPERVPGK